MTASKAARKMAMAVAGTEKKKRTKTKRSANFHRAIRKCAIIVNPDMTLSSAARATINSMVMDIFERLAAKCSHLVRMRNQETMRPKDVHSALLLVCEPELANTAINQSQKALHTFQKTVAAPE